MINNNMINNNIEDIHDLRTRIGRIYFVFSEEECLVILRENQNIERQQLRDECFRRWENMLINDRNRYAIILAYVLDWDRENERREHMGQQNNFLIY